MKHLQSLMRGAALTCIFLIATIQVTEAQTTLAADVPTTFDVSPTCAFSYSLPIEVPPGIKKLAPSLSISYSSQGGSGNLGMGWAVSGISAITRIVPTVLHHKLIDPVDFNASDVFTTDVRNKYRNLYDRD